MLLSESAITSVFSSESMVSRVRSSTSSSARNLLRFQCLGMNQGKGNDRMAIDFMSIGI